MAGTSVRLLPTGGEPMELEAATAHEDDPTVVILTVSETLADGDYQVMWRAMAQDGHTIRGDFGFAVSTSTPESRKARSRKKSTSVGTSELDDGTECVVIRFFTRLSVGIIKIELLESACG